MYGSLFSLCASSFLELRGALTCKSEAYQGWHHTSSHALQLNYQVNPPFAKQGDFCVSWRQLPVMFWNQTACSQGLSDLHPLNRLLHVLHSCRIVAC